MVRFWSRSAVSVYLATIDLEKKTLSAKYLATFLTGSWVGLKPVRRMPKERKLGGLSEVSKPSISGVVCPHLNGMSMTQGENPIFLCSAPALFPLLQGLIRWSHNQICKTIRRLFNYSLIELFISVEFVFKDATNPHLFGLNTYRIIPIGGPRHPVFVWRNTLLNHKKKKKKKKRWESFRAFSVLFWREQKYFQFRLILNYIYSEISFCLSRVIIMITQSALLGV